MRNQIFYDQFLSGSVLDVGCGSDLVVRHAQPFDLAQGDANRIAEFLPHGTAFDCVHSSHCLEHMRDVRAAVAGWWSLVRPGGYMIIVVPHEDLYEQGIWPPVFNRDHKATFRIGEGVSWSPVSYDLTSLLSQLPGAQILDIQVQDRGYDYSKRRTGISRAGRALLLFRRARQALARRAGVEISGIELRIQRAELALGLPMDQTFGEAMAQIQVVVQKQQL